MNWCEVQNDWEQFRFVLRSYWGGLTDDELNRIAANRNELKAVLQQRYGISTDEAERQVVEFEKDIRQPGAVK